MFSSRDFGFQQPKTLSTGKVIGSFHQNNSWMSFPCYDVMLHSRKNVKSTSVFFLHTGIVTMPDFEHAFRYEKLYLNQMFAHKFESLFFSWHRLPVFFNLCKGINGFSQVWCKRKTKKNLWVWEFCPSHLTIILTFWYQRFDSMMVSAAG